MDNKNNRYNNRIAERNLNKRYRIIGLISLILLVMAGFWFQSLIAEERYEEDYGSISDPLARISSLDELNPKTREAAELFLKIAEDEGLNVKITETYRTQERQEYLYEQGRTRLGPVVTWTTNSQHTKRNAFDIAKNVRGEEYSDLEFFRRAAEIGRSIGLEAGYYWRDGQQDMPHFQMNRFGRVIYPDGYE
ncbi:MAG TPA: M15 family metallopeptidase [Bacteroidales bacterium]|nr:M15 family metallopeptidase [Bacteroidales bacterium]